MFSFPYCISLSRFLERKQNSLWEFSGKHIPPVDDAGKAPNISRSPLNHHLQLGPGVLHNIADLVVVHLEDLPWRAL